MQASIAKNRLLQKTRGLAAVWKHLFLTLILIRPGAAALHADDGVTDLNPPVRAIVVSPQANLMQGDEAKNTIPPGQLLTFVKAKGDWRYTPDFRGWVSVRDVVLLEQAVPYFTNVIRTKPTPAAYHHRGIAYAAQQDWANALKDFQEAIRRGEGTTFVYVNRGLALREQGQTAQAIKDFTQAISIDPKNTQAYMLRGLSLMDDGHYEAAVKDFEAAASNAPKAPDPQNQLGVALRALDRNDEALAAFEKALTLAPKHAEALANRGFSRCLKGEFAGAVADYEAALELQPNNPEFLNDFAWLLATCRDESFLNADRALELSKKANELTGEPPLPEFLDTLAAAYARKGDFKSAITTAGKALQAMKNDPNAPAAEVHARLKLYEKGQPYTEKTAN